MGRIESKMFDELMGAVKEGVRGKRDVGMDINTTEARVRLVEEETCEGFGIGQETIKVVTQAMAINFPQGLVIAARFWIIKADNMVKELVLNKVSEEVGLQEAKGLAGEERRNFLERVYWMLMVRKAAGMLLPGQKIDESRVEDLMRQMRGEEALPKSNALPSDGGDKTFGDVMDEFDEMARKRLDG